jgi:transposase, IS5 family
VLTLWAPQAECLWDESLPVEVKELPRDLAELDRVLGDPELMMVLLERWRQEVVETGRAVLSDGRPTIAMETYVRLMVLKARYRWGYRVLVAEVSDSIHLRRFCRISLGERVPDESTVRKLTRRIGAEAVSELTRSLIETAVREKRFRPRAVRIDSTVVEADVRYPTDADLAWHGVKVLCREGRKLAGLVKERKARVRDRSRSMGRKLRALTRSIRRRSGEAKAVVLALTEQTGALLERSVREARKLAAVAKRRAVGRGAAAKRKAAEQLTELADRCEKVASQIRQRVAGKPIPDRLVSLADPDARPIRKGKLGKPNEFGYVSQICEITEHTRQGARGLILATSTRLGNPPEDALLPDTIGKLIELQIKPREIALDGGFNPGPTRQTLADHDLTPERVFIAGRQQPGSRGTQRRLRRYRTGAEGRISHLKRAYGMDRSRLKGDDGRQIWTGWAILAYNADTLAVRKR